MRRETGLNMQTKIDGPSADYRGYFDGSVALVTGGASGMGRAQARAIAAEGAKVAIFDINGKGGEETVRLIDAAGGEAKFFAVDATKADEVEKALEDIKSGFGPVKHLFNTAGTVLVKAYHETTEADYDRIMDINVRSAFIVTRRVIKQMVDNGGGTIVLMSSVSALRGFGYEALYGMSKSAIHGMMMNICAEYRQSNIRCCSVAPAFVRTPHGMGEIEQFKQLGVVWNDDAMKNTQLRICEPEEVASVSVFLSSPAANFLNGLSVQVDNGWMASG